MQHLSASDSVLIINKYQEITFNISHRNLTKKKHFQDFQDWLFPKERILTLYSTRPLFG